ncbi:MAG: 4-hydroxybenzoate octaprenyltransferase [Alphaproteobacteria bacterium]|nr:4-hydroxybenzoate octaprenyltransferase [Alphaproteobacteria bacterium]
MPQAAHHTKPLDSLPLRLVDSAPASIQPYLRLMRLDRPIGSWLLFWPCVFGMAAGAAARHMPLFATSQAWWMLALFALGTLVMRGAGCTYNDIVDRDFDAKVARTRGRPIPSGAISAKAATVFLLCELALGLAILMAFNRTTQIVGAASLLLVAAYPFMKRITWWPQAWLGLTFNWGALMGCAAVTGAITPAAMAIYGAGLFWTLGYDTIYACQDSEDDALIGVKSTARLFGAHAPAWVFFFYLASLVLLAAAGFLARLGLPFALLLIFVALHFLWQVHRLKPDRPQRCLKLFRANRDAGALIALCLVLSTWRF